jgi:hypothetical protein
MEIHGSFPLAMGKSTVDLTLSRLRPDVWQTVNNIYAL